MRQWTLPEDVDIDNIRSSLTEDGHLSIEAPKANPPAAALKAIPIQKAAKKEWPQPDLGIEAAIEASTHLPRAINV